MVTPQYTDSALQALSLRLPSTDAEPERLQMALDNANYEVEYWYGPAPTQQEPNLRLQWSRGPSASVWFPCPVASVLAYRLFGSNVSEDNYFTARWNIRDKYPRLNNVGLTSVWRNRLFDCEAIVVPEPQPWRDSLVTQLVLLEINYTGFTNQSGRGVNVSQFQDIKQERRNIIQSRRPGYIGNAPYSVELTADTDLT